MQPPKQQALKIGRDRKERDKQKKSKRKRKRTDNELGSILRPVVTQQAFQLPQSAEENCSRRFCGSRT
ncbi:hypothetical protein CEXT_475661 [Caerostris extrusa]|uniref:Uncharacterized protein n=1 Tax=Caerostris extrusa TaxID=172846 RepID=A0AAV4N963_CAEEX|nr:hypothetical protein CEXT_475661 [Caerostris extrusa]